MIISVGGNHDSHFPPPLDGRLVHQTELSMLILLGRCYYLTQAVLCVYRLFLPANYVKYCNDYSIQIDLYIFLNTTTMRVIQNSRFV